jgi:crotonobetainyl-CoA:carnitine CoA-transferase CaiB-like acyl-CoA transferase
VLSGPLAGRRVLELAGETGAYCGKLLGDLGADVVKLEPPGGCRGRRVPPFWRDEPGPDASLSFLYANTSKRSVTLDLARAEDRARLLRLARGADLLVETLPPGRLEALGLGFEALRAGNRRLVLTSITGFGQTGPRRAWRSTDLVASALGGAMQVIGEADDPPLRLAGRQAHVAASLVAASASLVAMLHAARSGEGQRVDVSLLEAVASVSHICGVGKLLDDGIVPRRAGAGLFASVPSGIYRCRDGAAYLMVNRPAHWAALARWVREVTGCEEILDPLFEGPSSRRIPYRELIDLWLEDFAGRFGVAELYEEGQRRHLAVTPVNAAGDVVRDPQLAARGFFVDVDAGPRGALRMPGAPYRLAATPWAVRRPAPRPGEHDAELRDGPAAGAAPAPGPLAAPAPPPSSARPAGALAGLRVVELSVAMAGPWIGRFMAWCGADVIRVESRKRPDVVRQYVPPRAPELGIQPRLSPWFTDWNAGKRFVALDLTRPRAVELARRLAATADVVVENQSTGVLAKLGLGYDALRAVRPDLVMLSTSGYGDTGPCRRYVTWGPNVEALSGLAALSALPGRAAAVTQFAYPDALAALHGLVAVLAALDHRARTGRGQYVSLAQYEATAAAIGPLLLERTANGREPPRLGNRSLRAAPQGAYRCAGEDRWCAITAADDADFARLCEVAGQPAWARDPRFATLAARLAHADALDAEIERWTSTVDAFALMEALQAAGVAAGVVQNAADLLRDPQLAARGFHEEIEHLARGRVVATGIPLGLTGTPGASGRSGAAVGEDNEAVLRGLLGLSGAEYAACVAEGAIEEAEPA